MTHFNNKEEAFKDILRGMELDIDTNALWNEVESQLPVRRDDDTKLPFFVWAMGGLLCLSLLAFMYQVVSTETAEAVAVSTAEQESDSDIFSSVKAYEAAIEKAASENKLARNEIENFDHSIKDQFSSQEAQGMAITLADDVNNRMVSKVNTQLSNPKAPLQNAVLNSRSSQITAPIFARQSDVQNTITNQENQLSFNSIVPKEAARNDMGSLTDFAFLKTEHFLHYERERAAVSIGDIVLIEPQQSTVRPQLISFVSASIGPNKNITCYTTLGQDIVSFDSPYEMDLIGFSSELKYGYHYGKAHFHFGINQSYLATRYSNHSLVPETIEVSGVESFTISTTGEKQENNGLVMKTTYNQYAIDWHRTHQNYDLMLGGGLDLISFGKWVVSADVGIQLGLYSKSSGYFINDDMTTIAKFSKSSESNYNSSTGLSSQFSIGLSRSINDIWGLQLRPYYTRAFSAFNEKQSYNLKNSQVGLLIGISYRPVWE